MAGGGRDVFVAAIDGISNDRFMAFLDRFTMNQIANPNALEADDGTPASRQRLHWVSTSEGGKREEDFSPAHFQAFSGYQTIFESRLKSVLKSHGGLSAEAFFDLCAELLDTPEVEGEAPSAPGDAKRDGAEAHEDPAVSTRELCQALLEMVDTVSDFSNFAAMMSVKERAMYAPSSDDDDDAAEE